MGSTVLACRCRRASTARLVLYCATSGLTVTFITTPTLRLFVVCMLITHWVAPNDDVGNVREDDDTKENADDDDTDDDVDNDNG